MEKKVIKHFCHEHPLILTENVSDGESLNCYGCNNPVTKLEATYVCIHQLECSNTRIILHKRCGELPSEIWHPKHPKHPMYLKDYHGKSGGWCDLCSRDLGTVFGYRCYICDFDVDLPCEKISIDALLEGEKQLQHPSHPDHPLTLMRKPSFAFCCDGCGTQDVDMAYICSTCEFWVHKSCALLPLILPINRKYHHHQLSLAFSFPVERRYVEFRYKCDACNKDFDTTCWVYFCGDCRFFAHLKCVTSTTETTKEDSNLDDSDNDGSKVIQFPLYVHDISKELITPFVMREKGLSKMPDVKDMPTVVNMPETTASFSFLFNYHKHPLSLVSECHEYEEDDNKIMDEDDEETNEALKICNICITPISSPPYYECAACIYFVHSICYLLPKTLSSSSPGSPHLYGDCPEKQNNNHKFTLYTSSESTDMDEHLYRCDLCDFYTNGMVYECEGCKMKIDVKCASLPTSIRHASHPHHKPLVLTRIQPKEDDKRNKCHGCERKEFNVAYCCNDDDCDFSLDIKCAQLPLSIIKHEWDNHPILLTFDASLDHPSDFFCDFCEEEIHPKKWMYHCRQCDHSFHLLCLKTLSGWYRNIKFGRRFVLDGIHPHPLTFNCGTLKKRCNICPNGVYDYGGLECVSCNYVVCLPCVLRELTKKM